MKALFKRFYKSKHQIPTQLSQVTLKQLVAYQSYNKKRHQIVERLDEETNERNIMLLDLQLQDVLDRLLVSISNLNYKELVKLSIDKKTTVYQQFKPILEQLPYVPNKDKSIINFKFNKERFYLFEFGDITTKQMLFFETYWKAFYQKISNEVIQMNFEKLPRLIAICAFKKGEINMIINDDREVPFEIKPEYYQQFAQLVEERTILFQNLPLDIVYGCLNFFFANSRSMRTNIQTYIKVKGVLKTT